MIRAQLISRFRAMDGFAISQLISFPRNFAKSFNFHNLFIICSTFPTFLHSKRIFNYNVY